MKVLLLIPPTDLQRSYGALKRFSNPQPSIGIAYIAALLRDNGHCIRIVDAYVNNYGLDEIINILEQFRPEVIGISLLTPSAGVVYEISKNIRRLFHAIKIVMGNMHASLFATEILINNYADIIVHGEGELTMLELINVLEKKGSINDINGISFVEDGTVVNTTLRSHIKDLDTLPFPAWDLFPMEKYSTDPRTEVKRGILETQILATRGCPNQCTFCSSRTERSMGAQYRMRDPVLVVDEMAFMNKRYNSEVFGFMDLSFPLVKEHAIRFCNEVIKRKLAKKIKWFTECRVKPLEEDLLRLMKRAGCVRVCFGIESGDDDILHMLKKNFSTHDVIRAVRMAQDVGLQVDGMFMIGLPKEDENKINKTVDFALRLNLRYAIFNIFVPYPGCELYDVLNKEGKIHFRAWADFTSYPTYSGGMPVYAPDSLSKDKIMELQMKAMRKFYLRPRFVMQEIRNFKPHKIMHYVEGLRGIVFAR